MRTITVPFHRALASLVFLCLVCLAGISPKLAQAEDLDPPQSILDDPDYDPSIPWYQSLRSRWGLQFRTGIRNFPSTQASGNLYQVAFEWMIPFQKAGILSLGGAFGGIHNLQIGFTNQSISPMVGGLIRYQLKVFKNQPIVPTAAVTYDYYRIPNGGPFAQVPSGTLTGFSYGLMLNLTWIDQVTARDAYRSLGLTKAYLTAEISQPEFKNSVFVLKPTFYLFGLRMEFE